jgi:hypothetical protein
MIDKGYSSAYELDTFSEFLEYIEITETDFKAVGDTLRHASELYAKSIFEGFIKANLQGYEVTIDDFTLNFMRDCSSN